MKLKEELVEKEVLIIFSEDGTTRKCYGKLKEITDLFVIVRSKNNTNVINKQSIINIKVFTGEPHA